MNIIKDIEIGFYMKSEVKGEDLRGNTFKSAIVMNHGSISFAINKLGIQFLVEQKILENTLKNNKSVKTDGVVLKYDKDNIMPINCIIEIDATSGAVIFQPVGANYMFIYKNGLLQETLKNNRKILN